MYLLHPYPSHACLLLYDGRGSGTIDNSCFYENFPMTPEDINRYVIFFEYRGASYHNLAFRPRPLTPIISRKAIIVNRIYQS